jgi:hypothetical protein
VSARATSPRLLQHQRAFLADRGREFLRDHRQQPWQRDFQAHVVIGDIDEADGALAERAEIEGEPIAAPAFLMDGQQRGIVRARGDEAGLDAARRLFAAEAVGDGHDQGLGHFEAPRMQAFIWGCRAFMPAIRPARRKEGSRSAIPLCLECALGR